MTRIRKILLLLAVAVLLPWAARAQDEPIKIGVVDVEQAMKSTVEGKAALEELARKSREAESQVRPMADRYKELDEELQGKKYVLSDEALFNKQVELAELQNRIQNKLKELEGQLKIDQGRLEAPLRAKLATIVEEIGKEQGFTLIMAREMPGMIYAREAIDITDQVVRRFDKKS
jgi:outer membrane protein